MSDSSKVSLTQNSSDCDRLEITYLLDNEALEREDIKEIIAGLTAAQKTIAPRYFYDKKGSQLFEQICNLPEYYPTRIEATILRKYAPEIIAEMRSQELVELGSGSSTKTRLLLDAYLNSQQHLYYAPIDVSETMLQVSSANLLDIYPQLKIHARVATYSQALESLSSSYLGKRTIIFLGSSIGNFTPQECDRFLAEVTNALNDGDYFLLGIDLQKSPEIIEAAYNDSQGVTAAFNLNILQHLNTKFAGNFNLELFEHEAIYNRKDCQIEMYLTSKIDCSVEFKKLNLALNFQSGEKILTEISRKFDLSQITNYLKTKNLQVKQTYTDDKQWFALLLCQFNDY